MTLTAFPRLRALACSALVAAGLALPAATWAAEQTVADVREELTLLNRQVQEIREALVATGPVRGLPQDPATALQRVDQLEAVLRRLTDRVDVLTNELNQIVLDASNRIDDIEFRLTELEGGDTSLVGRGEPLGGGITTAQPTIPQVPMVSAVPQASPAPPLAPAAPSAAAPSAAAPQLAVSERADFEAAKAALDEGRHGEAARLFDAFLTTYPGGPLAGEAQQLKGDALSAQGDWRGAARSYLDAFSGAPDAPTAPRALYRLAVSLGRLGQTEEACLTLTEVDIRYPASEVAAAVADERRSLACP